MSTVTPPPPNTPVPQPSGPVNAAATALNPPQAVLNLQPGSSLPATLTGQIAPGQLQVDTPLGSLTLQTALSLPRGAALTLVLTSQNPQPTFQITTQNAAQNVHAGSAKPGQSGAPAPSAPPVSAGQSLSATLLRPAVGQATPPSAQGASAQASQAAPGTPQAAPGAPTAPGSSTSPGAAVSPAQAGQAPAQAPSQAPSQASAASTLGGTPAQAAQAQGAQGQGVQGATARPAASASQAAVQAASQSGTAKPGPGGPGQGTPGTGSTPTSPAASLASQGSTPVPPQSVVQTVTLPAGSRFSTTVQNVNAPSTSSGVVSATATGAAKALAQGQVLVGTAAGRTVGGQPIVQTPAATFALGTQGALADGAKVTFRLDSAPLPPAPAGSATEALHGTAAGRELIQAQNWHDLNEALKALAVADPARLAQVAQNALPQPGAKLSSQMLFLLSALKGGDLRSLFGDTTMRLLETERPELATRLGADFQAMAKLADEPQSGDWRLALIPLWSGEKLEQLRLFWRHGSAGEEGDDAAEETRFVVDLDLTQLGHLQIDGLVKPKRNHLDLILRTDTPLPDEMRVEIADIFEAARDLVGLSGQVSFQTDPPNFIAIPEPVPDAGAALATPPHGPGVLA